jgi:hypothetical protein
MVIYLILVCLFAFKNWSSIWTNCEPDADIALIELQIDQASTGDAFMGVYSRFSFHHPGPISFYYFALVGKVFGEQSIRVHQFAEYLLSVILIGMALQFINIQVRNKYFLGLVLVSFYLLFLIHDFSYVLYFIWNPSIGIFLSFAFIVIISSYRLVNFYIVSILALIGSLLFQNHVGSAIIIGPFLAYYFFKTFQSTEIDKKRWIFSIGLFGFLNILFLLPALMQEWNDFPNGNLIKIFEFMKSNGGIKRNFWKASGFVGSYFLDPFFHYKYIPDQIGGSLIYFLCVGLVWKLKFENRFLIELKKVWLGGMFLFLYSALGMKGTLVKHSLWMSYSFVWIGYAMLFYGYMLIPILKFSRKYAKLVIDLQWILWIVLISFTDKPPAECVSYGKLLLEKIHPSRDLQYKLFLPFDEKEGEIWVILSQIVNHLEENGYKACVNQEWDILFEKEWICDSFEPSPSSFRISHLPQKNLDAGSFQIHNIFVRPFTGKD